MPVLQKHMPVNPNASSEACALLASLYEISGAAILSGQHNTPNHLSEYSAQAEEITGSRPCVWGQDFGFSADDLDNIACRPSIISEAKRQHASGAIITLMWHAVRPIEDEPVTFKDGICGKMTDDEWQALITPGTAVYNRWTAQVDTIAAFLTQLRDASVPVLWRPYHEMNGDWFWWGFRAGEQGYAALYRQLYHRLVTIHHLDNLIWVWNANAPAPHILPYAACYPGPECVDVLATDVYHNDYRQSHHDDLVALADGRPVALGEVGELPTPAILDAQPQWVWFMVWTNFLTRHNTPEAVRAVYNRPKTLTLAAADQ